MVSAIPVVTLTASTAIILKLHIVQVVQLDLKLLTVYVLMLVFKILVYYAAQITVPNAAYANLDIMLVLLMLNVCYATMLLNASFVFHKTQQFA